MKFYKTCNKGGFFLPTTKTKRIVRGHCVGRRLTSTLVCSYPINIRFRRAYSQKLHMQHAATDLKRYWKIVDCYRALGYWEIVKDTNNASPHQMRRNGKALWVALSIESHWPSIILNREFILDMLRDRKNIITRFYRLNQLKAVWILDHAFIWINIFTVDMISRTANKHSIYMYIKKLFPILRPVPPSSLPSDVRSQHNANCVQLRFELLPPPAPLIILYI